MVDGGGECGLGARGGVEDLVLGPDGGSLSTRGMRVGSSETCILSSLHHFGISFLPH